MSSVLYVDILLFTSQMTKKTFNEPSPYAVLELGNQKVQTFPKEKTTNPKWEQTFEFFVSDPVMQDLNIEVRFKSIKMTNIKYC